MRTLRTTAAIGAIMLLAAATPARAVQYDVLDLGQGVEATGLNSAGQVVGAVIVDGPYDRAFITGPNGNGRMLLATLGGPASQATGANRFGQAIGVSYTTADVRDGPFHAFLTGPGGVGISDLGTLGGVHPVYGDVSVAHGVNNAGVVVGSSYIHGGDERAFVTDAGGGNIRVLDALAGSDYSSYAGAVNDAGRVAGVLNDAGSAYGFLTGPDGVGYSIFAPPTLSLIAPAVLAINERGQVVGDYRFDPSCVGCDHAFLTGPDGVGIFDLGTLGGIRSTGQAVDSFGRVVGVAYTAGGDRHAFVTGVDGVGMMDLNDFVSLPAGAILYSATGINDRGQIIANSGNGRAYLLTPVPEPASAALLCAGLAVIAGLARLRIRAAAPA